jgi:putative transposase
VNRPEPQSGKSTANARRDSGFSPVPGGRCGSSSVRGGIPNPEGDPPSRGSANIRRDGGFSPVRGGLRAAKSRPGSLPGGARNLPTRVTRPRLSDFDYRGEYAYHVTIRTAGSSRPFEENSMDFGITEYLEREAAAADFRVLAYCFMPDHVHLLMQGSAPESDLRRFVSRFKQQAGFAYKQRTQKQLWQTSYFDRTLRRDEDLQTVADYIFQNPVKAGMVDDAHSHRFSGGLYFARVAPDPPAPRLRNPEAAADRAEAAVPTMVGGNLGRQSAESGLPAVGPEAAGERAKAAVPTMVGGNLGRRSAESGLPAVGPEAAGDRAEATVPTRLAPAPKLRLRQPLPPTTRRHNDESA